MCVLHLNTGRLGHVHTTKTTRVKLRDVRLVEQTCVLWVMGEIKSWWIWWICITFRNFFFLSLYKRFTLCINSAIKIYFLWQKSIVTLNKISAHADGGPRSCVCTLATLPLGPPLTWAKIFRHRFLQSHLQTSTPTLKTHIRCFGTLQQPISPFVRQK